MCGIVHAKILTPKDARIPLFGVMVNDSYMYGSCAICIKKSQKRPCRHSDQNRAILATLCWNEANFAVSIGYTFLQIYECYQYSTEAKIFQKFYSLLAREKIRYSEPIGSDIAQYLKNINQRMNFPESLRLTAEDIVPHKTKRQHCKQDLNMVFGKLSQQNMRSKPIVIKSQSELEYVDLKTIENVFPLEKTCLLVVKNQSKGSKHNRRGNSILYSYVLAYSRIHMYRAIFRLSEKSVHVYQISNDALYLSLPLEKNLSDFIDMGAPFGQFRDEHPNCKIVSFAGENLAKFGATYGNT